MDFDLCKVSSKTVVLWENIPKNRGILYDSFHRLHNTGHHGREYRNVTSAEYYPTQTGIIPMDGRNQ